MPATTAPAAEQQAGAGQPAAGASAQAGSAAAAASGFGATSTPTFGGGGFGGGGFVDRGFSDPGRGEGAAAGSASGAAGNRAAGLQERPYLGRASRLAVIPAPAEQRQDQAQFNAGDRRETPNDALDAGKTGDAARLSAGASAAETPVDANERLVRGTAGPPTAAENRAAAAQPQPAEAAEQTLDIRLKATGNAQRDLREGLAQPGQSLNVLFLFRAAPDMSGPAAARPATPPPTSPPAADPPK
jgi:hypothetical protein